MDKHSGEIQDITQERVNKINSLEKELKSLFITITENVNAETLLRYLDLNIDYLKYAGVKYKPRK